MGWRIVNWEKHYEVNNKNQPYREGDTVRRGRLDYIRLKSYGKRQSVAYRQLLGKARASGIARIYGMFCKFLEIAGDAEGGHRGVLLNQNDDPATAKDIAFMIGCPERQVQSAIEVLCWPGVRWLEWVGSPESPGIPGKLPSTQTQTQTQNNSDEDKEKKNRTPKIAFKYNVWLTQTEYDKLVAKHGQAAAGKMIEKLSNHKGATGKTYKSDYRAILNWVVEWWQEKGSKLAKRQVASQPGKYDAIESEGAT